ETQASASDSRLLRGPVSQNSWRQQKWALLQQFMGVTDGNGQVRAAKIFQNGGVHTNDLPIAIEERSAGTAGGCRRVVNKRVRQDISDVSLGCRWANQALGG